MKRITILGATGSVGEQTLDLVRRSPANWQVVALTARTNTRRLAELAREFRAEVAVVADEASLPELQSLLKGAGVEAAGGLNALREAASRPCDLSVAAIVGVAGLDPTMAAIEQGCAVALANKEALVSAGSVMTAAVARTGANLLPVDSEHNAIFQCLQGNALADVRKITLTASGGPLRGYGAERLVSVTPAEAVAHPNWDMGAKISVDSATMMNKGLELIEAYHLFPLDSEAFAILVHPQSVIHSMVEYRDGSTLAQLGPADMRVPIASCLAWPERMETPCVPLDLVSLGELTFFAPDEELFPATRIAREALLHGGTAPGILNAANEVAVAAFLSGHLPFNGIPVVVERTLEVAVEAAAPASLAEVLEMDRHGRAKASEILGRM